MKVLIAPSQFGEGPLRRLAELGFESVPNPYRRKLTRGEVVELLQGVPGIVAGLEPLDKEVLSRTALKVISRCGSGMTNVDAEEAARLGIKVYSTPNGPTTAVAEATLSALLQLLRNFDASSRDLHAGRWTKSTGRQLKGRTAAIIGMGRIGSEVARLLSAFGVTILAVDPCLADRPGPWRSLSLESALRQADIVCVHASHDGILLGPAELALLPRGAIVLNAARGGLVDEAALAEGLRTGRLYGAWLDVFSVEPYQGPLAELPNALLTPHIASYTVEGRETMEMECVENLAKGFRG